MEENKVYEDLVKAQTEFSSVKFDSKNPHYKSQYASLGAFVEAIKKSLNHHGFFFSQPLEMLENGDTVVNTLVIHKSGTQIKMGSSVITRIGKTDQQFGSSVTYHRRYQISAAFGLFADEDDDAETSVGRGKYDESQPKHETVKEEKKISQSQLKIAMGLIGENDSLMDEVLKLAKIKTLDELPQSRFDGLLKHLERKTQLVQG